MVPFFKYLGKTSDSETWLQSQHIHWTTVSPPALSILTLIPSMLGDLFFLKALVAFLTSTSFNFSVLIGSVPKGSWRGWLPTCPGYLRRQRRWQQCWKCWLSWRPSWKLLWRISRLGGWASWFACPCTVGMFSLCYWRICLVDLWRLVHLVSVIEMCWC